MEVIQNDFGDRLQGRLLLPTLLTLGFFSPRSPWGCSKYSKMAPFTLHVPVYGCETIHVPYFWQYSSMADVYKEYISPRFNCFTIKPKSPTEAIKNCFGILIMHCISFIIGSGGLGWKATYRKLCGSKF